MRRRRCVDCSMYPMVRHRSMYTPISDMPRLDRTPDGQLVAIYESDGAARAAWSRRAWRILEVYLRRRRSQALQGAIARTRPWIDRLEVAEALAEIMPFGWAG